MRVRALVWSGVVMGVVATGGCTEVAMSPRERAGDSLADAVVAIGPPAVATTRESAGADVRSVPAVDVAPTLRLAGPMRLGVAQLGEVAPPMSMTDGLRKRSDLFAVVEPMMVGMKSDGHAAVDREAVDAARRQAGQMGLDYLLICGGTIDQKRKNTPLAAFDLTIVGAFVVPSVQVSADGRATGMVVDVRSGRSVFTVNTEASAASIQPEVSARDTVENLTDVVRAKMADGLTARTIERVATMR